MSSAWNSLIFELLTRQFITKTTKKHGLQKKKKEYLFIIATDTLGKISSKANKACRTVDSYGYKNITHNKTIIMNF